MIPIALPPLRKRKEDIPGLCELFCRDVARELKTPPRRVSPDALNKLGRYDFPGNLRELRNLIERAMILSAGSEIGLDDLPLAGFAGAKTAQGNGKLSWIAAMPAQIDLRELLEEVEKNLIVRALESAAGVQAEAARRLHLSRSDLAYKLAKYEIKAERE